MASDLPTYITFNHTDRRDKIEVKKGGVEINATNLNTFFTSSHQFGSQFKANSSNTTSNFTMYIGIANDTDVREITLEGIRCLNESECYTGTNGNISEIKDKWSDDAFWTRVNVTRPSMNQSLVTIDRTWNLLLDQNITVQVLIIDGRLTLDPSKNINIIANHIYVRKGEFLIGNSTHPYLMNAKITLTGSSSTKGITRNSLIEAGD
jgi:hypothetical protein